MISSKGVIWTFWAPNSHEQNRSMLIFGAKIQMFQMKEMVNFALQHSNKNADRKRAKYQTCNFGFHDFVLHLT